MAVCALVLLNISGLPGQESLYRYCPENGLLQRTRENARGECEMREELELANFANLPGVVKVEQVEQTGTIVVLLRDHSMVCLDIVSEQGRIVIKLAERFEEMQDFTIYDNAIALVDADDYDMRIFQAEQGITGPILKANWVSAHAGVLYYGDKNFIHAMQISSGERTRIRAISDLEFRLMYNLMLVGDSIVDIESGQVMLDHVEDVMWASRNQLYIDGRLIELGTLARAQMLFHLQFAAYVFMVCVLLTATHCRPTIL